MQGDKAVDSIIKMLEEIYEHEEDFDLVVIIRGGGAKLDLECFNNYDLAYHITQFPLPVLTGIGHERDETIADLVAHTKLKTPTAMAEFLIDSMASFLNEINNYQERILNFAGNEIHTLKSDLNRYSISLFELITRKISDYRTKLNKFGHETEISAGKLLMLENSRLTSSQNELKSKTLLKIKEEQRIFESSIHSLKINSPKIIKEEKQKLENHKKALAFLDPVNILKRGFSISFKDGVLIKDSKSLKNNDEILTKFHKGEIKSTVNKK